MAFKKFTSAEREAASARELAEQEAAESEVKVVIAARMAIVDALVPVVSKMSPQDARFFDGLTLDRIYFDRDGVAGGSLARLSEQRANGLRVLAERYLTADTEHALKEHLAHLYRPWVYCSPRNAKLCSGDIAPGEKAEDRCIPCPDRQGCDEEARGL